MNNLSWLLYWADVLPSISTFFAFVFFGASAFFLFLFGVYLFCPESDAEAQGFKFTRWLAPLCVLMWGLTYLVPTKDTFYLIAASEAGEEAVQTPEFTKLRRLLNGWLDEQLEEEEEEDTENDQ